jgi:hypothetical protein
MEDVVIPMFFITRGGKAQPFYDTILCAGFEIDILRLPFSIKPSAAFKPKPSNIMNETAPPPPDVAPQPKTSALAIWSLVLGILALLFLLVCISPLFAVPGVICAHLAHSRIKRSGGALDGQGMALAGLITNYVSIGLSVFLLPMMMAIAIPNFVKARNVSMQNACINNLRQIDGAKNEWALENNKTNGTPVIEADIKPHLKLGADGNFPKCPAGGTYTIGRVGKVPICSVPEHKLTD